MRYRGCRIAIGVHHTWLANNIANGHAAHTSDEFVPLLAFTYSALWLIIVFFADNLSGEGKSTFTVLITAATMFVLIISSAFVHESFVDGAVTVVVYAITLLPCLPLRQSIRIHQRPGKSTHLHSCQNHW